MRAPVVLAGAVFAVVALAADGNLDLARSSLVVSFRQQAVSVDAAFRRFDGEVDYDPAHPASTRAALSVDMTSLDVGDEDSNAEVLKAAWFDAARFPRATFRSTAVEPTAPGQFDARGELTVKGRTQPLTVSVSVRSVGGTLAFDGSFEISRRQFDLGDPSWDPVLDDKVRVRFRLLAASH